MQKTSRVKEASADKSQIGIIETSMETGAYNWLSVLPIEKQGFTLDKRSFCYALRLRYNLPLSHLPEKCACGSTFNIQHAFSCNKGGFISR